MSKRIGSRRTTPDVFPASAAPPPSRRVGRNRRAAPIVLPLPARIDAGPWVITIPRALASQNRAPTNGRFGWQYRRDRGLWLHDVAMAARAAGVTPATARRRITIARLIGKRQREWDVPNLWGGVKLLLDVCCQDRTFRGKLRPGAGLIVDDAPRWAEVVVSQEKSTDGVAATRITVEELPP